MERPVTPLDDGGIGILANGAVFERKQMLPMPTVIAHGDAQGGARTLGGAGKGREIIIDEYMTAITKGDGICARLIVGHIGKHYLAPTLSAVTAEGSGQTPVARAAQNLKPAIRMTKDGRLDALDGLDF